MQPTNNPQNERSRLDRLTLMARLALVWELAWPLCVALFGVMAVFLALSWLGLWVEMPRWARIGGVAVFAAGLVAFLVLALPRSLPSRAQALKRLDRDSGLAHRPASALEDDLANPGSDPATRALWALHQKRMRAQAARLKLAPPSPRLAARDRYALRAAAVLGLAATAFVAGPERYLRVAAAFDWREASAIAQGFRVDAWIDPPAYTGRPPILLDTSGKNDGSTVAVKVDAPVGSVLVLRVPPDAGFAAQTVGALEAVTMEAAKGAAATKPGAHEDGQRFALKGDATLVLQRNGAPMAAFDLHAIADRPPVIALTEPVQPNLRGSMTLNYKIEDDYGATSAEANFARPVLRGKPVTGRSLVEAPRVGLTLPATSGGIGEGSTQADLSEHAWAGARVTMTLSARDEGGNVGTSEPAEIVLPQRPFTKPMALALAEQRRNLVLAPDDASHVAAALDGLMLAPDEFNTGASVFLGLRTAKTRLKLARSDADLIGVADFLWEMALRIEDGDLSDTERDLRAAEAKLREAMQRGAPDEEIAKLMGDVRTALDKFMKELAEKQMRENGPEQRQADNRPNKGKMLTPEDFKAMMDRMEDMARSGNLAEAQKMLDQMQKMLENLKTARRRPPDPKQQEMAKALDELDALAREEQNLRDDTYKQDQKQRKSQKGAGSKPKNPPKPGGQKGQPPQDSGDQADNGDQDEADQGDAPSSDQMRQQLKDRQEALRKRLEALQKRLEQQGMSAEEGLGEAQDAMKDAEGALGEGESGTGKAVGPQGEALDALRKGAKKLADAMQPGEGEGDDQAGDDNPGEDGQGPTQRNGGRSRDPLNRQTGDKDRPNDYKGKMDPQGTPAQRAQKVQEELRRRLGDTSRAQEERDFFERLLKRY